MQEPRLRHPASLLDQLAMHDRDLPGRSAEAQQRDPGPDADGFAEADAVRDRRVFGACVTPAAAGTEPVAAIGQAGVPEAGVQLCVSCCSERHQV